MKIRLKVSVKTRGGKIFIPGVYNLKDQEVLAELLKDVKDDAVFEALYIPEPVVEAEEVEEEEGFEEEAEEETEEEEAEEEKPKKKKKKKRVI